MADKDSIRVRKRLLKNGNKSIYLDIYRNGKREYEFLKLYWIPEKSKIDKEKNRHTMQLAEAIKSKRLVSLQNKEFGFNDNFKLETNFLDYYRAMCEDRKGKESLGNWGNWYSALKHLERYCDPKTTFKDVTPEFVKGFKEYLDKTARAKDKRKTISIPDDSKPLSQNSKQSYFNKLRACINQAFEDRIMPYNPLRGIEGFKAGETERSYLTLEEIKRMAAEECQYNLLKRTFLFSCLTGIRKSDIEKMTWGEVHQQGNFTRIIFKQQKTGGQEYLDINEQAAELLGERGDAADRVFSGFKYSAYANVELQRWALRAGITKHLTFHVASHTANYYSLKINTLPLLRR